MALLTTNSGGVLSPEEVATLVVQPLQQKSVVLANHDRGAHDLVAVSCGCRSSPTTCPHRGLQEGTEIDM